MSSRPAIPTVRTGQPDLDRALVALRSNVEGITGQERDATPLQRLDPTTASTSDIVATVNAIIDRLEGSVPRTAPAPTSPPYITAP